MEKKRSKNIDLPAIPKLESEECSLAGFFFWIDDSNSVSQKYLDSITARLPDGPLSVTGGTDRKWHQSEDEEAEITPCEQPQYRFRPHFDTQKLYASDITPIP
jgi:hypothetical protein